MVRQWECDELAHVSIKSEDVLLCIEENPVILGCPKHKRGVFLVQESLVIVNFDWLVPAE